MNLLHDFLNPHLSPHTQAFIRLAYGLLLLGTLLMALPHGRRFFMSERWGGYAQSATNVDIIQNPLVYPLVMAGWTASAILITLGWWSVWAALVNLLLCRYFFVYIRWKGVLRGMGAPGFMTYWLGIGIFLLEYTLHYAPHLQSLALRVLQIDFALIMLSAGIYKFTAGYLRNHGMELGLVNPEWGYWRQLYARLSPEHWLFKMLNQLAWSTEVVAALLMLFPPTRFWGGLLISLSFIFVATQIRLGLLCPIVIVSGFLFFHPGSPGDQLINYLVPTSISSTNPTIVMPPLINTGLAMALWGYLILLPLAHAGLFYNFYGRKSLPHFLQRILENYTNFLGIIIWRVFSVDIINFFILVHQQLRASGKRILLSRYGWPGSLRYNHVAESITITSVFTTLKYYPSNSKRFTERLLRYVHTVPCPTNSVLVFEYISIVKGESRFEFVPVAEYIVDPIAGTLEERILNETISVRAAHAVSPVHEGLRPGSYAPLRGQ